MRVKTNTFKNSNELQAVATYFLLTATLVIALTNQPSSTNAIFAAQLYVSDAKAAKNPQINSPAEDKKQASNHPQKFFEKKSLNKMQKDREMDHRHLGGNRCA